MKNQKPTVNFQFIFSDENGVITIPIFMGA